MKEINKDEIIALIEDHNSIQNNIDSGSSIKKGKDELIKEQRVTSPINGILLFADSVLNNQYIPKGKTICQIISKDSSFRVTSYIPVVKYGKVKIGQKVHLSLDNYPQEEYGIIVGKIESISILPINGYYFSTVNLDKGLVTSYKSKIPFQQEMEGTASIITEDLTMSDRILLKFKRITSN